MRIAKLHIDPADKQRFEIHGKGSVKYHLKANHIVEAKRWYWTLNNAIQQAKDEARLDERKKREESEVMDRLREQVHNEETAAESDAVSDIKGQGSISASENIGFSTKRASVRTVRTTYGGSGGSGGGDQSDVSVYAPKSYSINTDGDLGDDEEDDIDDDASSHGPDMPPTSDELALAANSARLQLDLLGQVALALQFEHASNPDLKLSDASVVAAMASYESAAGSLKQIIGSLLSMSKERDIYWRYRMEKEIALRRLWEESMMKLAEEQEALEGEVLGERERRKKTKRALRRVLRKDSGKVSRPDVDNTHDVEGEGVECLEERLKEVELNQEGSARRSLDIDEELSDSDDSDQFFDAIDAGELEVVTEMPSTGLKSPLIPLGSDDVEDVGADTQLEAGLRQQKLIAVKTSFIGYEDRPRNRLAMDTDDRPKISLWVRMNFAVHINICD